MKSKFLLALFAVAVMLTAKPVYAQATVSSSEIQNSNLKQIGLDPRVRILTNYLKQYDSPLTPSAGEFVAMADKYNLDWRLVAAISGVESTFGKAIPPYSYNAWGWGVYGDNVINFRSWSDGIDTISEGLRERYMNQIGGDDIYQIGAMYASSSAWPDHVVYYMNQIQDFALRNPQDTLSISL